MDFSNFYHLPVKGDGACFFHSIVGINHLNEHLFTKNGKTITYKIESNRWDKESMNLRKKCIRWLKNNLDYRIQSLGTTIEDEIMEDLNTNDNINKKTLEGYFSYMSKRNGYAGQIEIYAIAELLQKNIRTYISKGNKLNNVGLGYEIKSKSLLDDIYLYHNLGEVGNAEGIHHFEILYPKKKAKIVSKAEYMNQFKKSVKSLQKKTKKLSSKRKRWNKMTRRKPKKKTLRRKKGK